MIRRGNMQRVVGVSVVALVLAALMALHVVERAGAGVAPCQQHRVDARERSQAITGTGPVTVVIGDSWSVGLGLDDLADSWPAHLPGEVHVAGFSGSGFSATASTCAEVSFAARAGRAIRDGADLVVVEGGLNDYDQDPRATRQGFRGVMSALAGHRVVVVGPADAPSRSAGAERVDALLAELARRHGVPYIATFDLSLSYLEDDLHLSEDGHDAFGEAVAQRLADVTADFLAQR